MAPKSARWYIALIVALALLALLGFAAAFATYRYTLQRVIESRRNEIRREGYPVTLAELDRWAPQSAPGENAANTYLEAFQRYIKPASDTNLPVEGSARTPPRPTPLPPEMKQAIADHLTANQETLDLLHKAATMKFCRYPADLSDAEKMIGSQLKQFAAARRGARLLYLELLLASENGNTERAVESITAARALAGSLNDRPLLLSYLVERACLGITISSLEQALSRAAFTEPQLVTISAAFQEATVTHDFARALIGERAFANEEWDGIRKKKTSLSELTGFSDETNDNFSRAVSVIYQPSGLMDLDYLANLDLLNGLINSSAIAFPQRFERINSLKNNAERFKALVLTHMEAELLGPSAKREARFIAQLRAAFVALQIERYRAVNGTLPDALKNLLPTFLDAIPTDPYNGQPLRYKKLAKGYVIYSVGEDGKDDGGVEPHPAYTPGTDITFTVER